MPHNWTARGRGTRRIVEIAPDEETQELAHVLRHEVLNANHIEVRHLKLEGHAPEIHGHKFWNSSFLMMKYLKKHPLKPGTRVLEIGCGWGLPGIFCAKEFNARVTGSDLDANVFPYLGLHAPAAGPGG